MQVSTFLFPFSPGVIKEESAENAMQVWQCKQTLPKAMHESPGYPAIMTTNAMPQHTPSVLQKKQGEITCVSFGCHWRQNASVEGPVFSRIWAGNLGLLWAATSTRTSSTTTSNSSTVTITAESTSATLESVATSTISTEVTSSTTVTTDFLEAIVTISRWGRSLLWEYGG